MKSKPKTIVAIGGGEIGRPGYPVETTRIDKEIIRLSGKKHPRLLFLPTASSDSADYYETVRKHFGKELGCKTDVLYLLKDCPAKKEIEEKILSSDIVYVGGGNTLKMMKVWRAFGVDAVLRKAWEKGVVMSGLSAGSVCWFRYGNSDSRKFSNPDADYIKIRGLGLIDALHCPHFDTEAERRPSLKKMMKKTPGVAIAVDNCCALVVQDESYRVVSSKKIPNAYKVYWKKGNFYKDIIGKSLELKPLKEIMEK